MITKLLSPLTFCFPRAKLRQQTAAVTVPGQVRNRSVLPMKSVSNEESYRPLGPDTAHEAPVARTGHISHLGTASRPVEPAHAAILHRAVTGGDRDAVQLLLSAGVDPNACHEGDDPPLLIALHSRHKYASDIAYLLVKAGANIKVECARNARTPLMHAIARQWASVIEILLERPEVQIHEVNSLGQSAYRLAGQLAVDASGGHAFEMLNRHDHALVRDASACGVRSEQGTNVSAALLHRAVTRGQLQAVKYLLQAKVDPNGCYGSNDPPVLLAANSTHECAPDILALLLQAGANPNTASAVGRTTPLIHAIRQGSVGMVKVLLNHPEINIHQADASGVSAYQHSVRMLPADAREEISDLLGEHRYNHSLKGVDEWVSAAMLGGLDSLITLKRLYALYGSAIVDAIGFTSRTALWEAANHGHVDVVKQLLDWGADPAFHNGDGITAVDQARRFNADDVVAAFEDHTQPVP